MTDEQLASQTAPDSSPDANTGLVNEGSSAPQTADGQGDQAPKISEGAEKRINDLVGKLKGESERTRALELEIAELRGRVSQGEQVHDEWAQLSDTDLLTISTQEDASAEQKAEALRRYHQRTQAKIDELTQEREQQSELQAKINQTWQGIVEDFPEANDKSSALYQKALEIYDGYRAKYGNDVDSDPRYQRMAFEVAQPQIASSNDARIQELEAELAKYRNGEQIEAAGNLASSSLSRSNQAVKAGDATQMGRDIAKKLLGGPPVI